MDIPADKLVDLFRRMKHTPESLRVAGEHMADRLSKTWVAKILGGVQVWQNLATGQVRRELPKAVEGVVIPADARIKIGELA